MLVEFLDYVRAGELKLAVEALCDALYDVEVRLLAADVADIQALGNDLGVTRLSLGSIAELVTEER